MKRATLRIITITVISLALIFSSYFFISWGSLQPKNFEEFTQWLNAESNKSIITKSIAGINVTVKYYPPHYVSLLTASNSKLDFTSNNTTQPEANTLTFLMTIAPDKNLSQERQAGSIMSQDVTSQSDFVDRVMSTNFFMDQYLTLYVDGVGYKPALCIVENLYELSDSRSFMVVFGDEDAQKLKTADEYVFEYNDKYFNIGKVQFHFSGSSIARADNIKIIQ